MMAEQQPAEAATSIPPRLAPGAYEFLHDDVAAAAFAKGGEQGYRDYVFGRVGNVLGHVLGAEVVIDEKVLAEPPANAAAGEVEAQGSYFVIKARIPVKTAEKKVVVGPTTDPSETRAFAVTQKPQPDSGQPTQVTDRSLSSRPDMRVSPYAATKRAEESPEEMRRHYPPRQPLPRARPRQEPSDQDMGPVPPPANANVSPSPPPPSDVAELPLRYSNRQDLNTAQENYARSTAARRASADGGLLHFETDPQPPPPQNRWQQFAQRANKVLQRFDPYFFPLATRNGRKLVTNNANDQRAYQEEVEKLFDALPASISQPDRFRLRLHLMREFEQRVENAWFDLTHANFSLPPERRWRPSDRPNVRTAESWINASRRRKVASVVGKGALVGAAVAVPLVFVTVPPLWAWGLGFLGAAAAGTGAKLWIGKNVETINKYQIAHDGVRGVIERQVARRLVELEHGDPQALQDVRQMTNDYVSLTRNLELANVRRKRLAEGLGSTAAVGVFGITRIVGGFARNALSALPTGGNVPPSKAPTPTAHGVTTPHPSPSPTPSKAPTPTPTPTPGGGTPGGGPTPNAPPSIGTPGASAFPWDVMHQINPNVNPLDALRNTVLPQYNQVHGTNLGLYLRPNGTWWVMGRDGVLHALNSQQQYTLDQFIVNNYH